MLVIAFIAFGAPTFSIAQAIVTPQPAVTLYRAFYFIDGMNTPAHIEVVRSLAGRSIQPIPQSFNVPRPEPTPPPETSAFKKVGSQVGYVIYYGRGDVTKKRPKTGDLDVDSGPLAMERLSEADAERVVECASPGGTACNFPKMCHCSGVGGCCCY